MGKSNASQYANFGSLRYNACVLKGVAKKKTNSPFNITNSAYR